MGEQSTKQMMLKNRWSLGHNYLSGMTFSKWLKLLDQEAEYLDPVYYHRVAFVTLMSLVNSVFSMRESWRYHDQIEATEVTHDPIFILGHWRSGTTHLHQLMALDTDQFSYPNTYQVINPETFLTTEAFNTKWFARLLPKKRPMDNIPLSFQSPQEDEFAPALLSLKSSYLGISFPKHEEHYEKYLSFKTASHEDRECWKNAMKYFVKKLTFKNPKRLVLKSPTHTARIKIILEAFPNAKFVHIHRDPVTVFQSFKHFYDTAMWYSYLQIPDLDRIEDRILDRYETLYDAYFEDQHLIPEGNFCEVSFRELEDQPVMTIQKIYDELQLSGWAGMQPRLNQYLKEIKNYEKNVFPQISQDTLERIRSRWSKHYHQWGYE